MVVQVKAETAAMFEQITMDFAPFTKTNISLEMVEQAYCACRRSGFRFQVPLSALLSLPGSSIPLHASVQASAMPMKAGMMY